MVRSQFIVKIFLFLFPIMVFSFNDATFIQRNVVSAERNTINGYDFKNKTYKSLDLIKLYTSDRIDLYSDTVNAPITGDRMKSIIQEFEKEMLPVFEDYFGKLPIKKLEIVFYDIPDNYGSHINDYYAGYFDSQLPDNHNRIFIDTYPTLIYENDKEVEGIIAHELQHLVHFKYDTDEENWVNEGLSEIATFVCGGENDYHIKEFISYPYLNMTQWNETIKDYGKVYLFFRYLIYRKGREVIRNILRNTENGITGLCDVIGYEGFLEFFSDFATAISLNDADELKYDIMGIDYDLLPLEISTGNTMITKVSSNAFSFSVIDFYPKFTGRYNLLLDDNKKDLYIKAAFYSKGSIVDVVDISDGEPFTSEKDFDRIRFIFINPTSRAIDSDIFLECLIPDIAMIKNPFFSKNRFFAIKGAKISNVFLEDRELEFFSYNDRDDFYMLSADIDIMKGNRMSVEFYFRDSLMKGEVIINGGTI
ncbi:MAG: hypothetical protein C0601_07160 [Candidatus Muiribacterium halophilum]|uniref:Uncharacterized protein n=1 Tax=Muiribacterium halophilum TaxID=2053465 RepID=A0A2N5ZFW9_MUIH1|nr:MAG: hypothetical protein C0601_07160 [Candidatus Muirbacterium halophilum]